MWTRYSQKGHVKRHQNSLQVKPHLTWKSNMAANELRVCFAMPLYFLRKLHTLETAYVFWQNFCTFQCMHWWDDFYSLQFSSIYNFRKANGKRSTSNLSSLGLLPKGPQGYIFFITKVSVLVILATLVINRAWFLHSRFSCVIFRTSYFSCIIPISPSANACF